ncbi:hypothetical protein AKJ52_01625 [candidate division MSBL1 archaeon SCGC-AAA382C18]|uniref:FAD-binding PCMH-type domain-containing protein n=1 Tax=candidate division MSBL1 archaeon SCGC-AAA382C18 TaxID=1698281 RepID=A0A133VK15_9EURY|nr:hypothetical protein AKJ52_01625 [candidate division MSBL1 archaeon SCGC-AAA382C18]
MALSKFNYAKPSSLDEATEILSKHGENAHILAGGTDLIPDIRGDLIEPGYVVDIKEIPELNKLSFDEGEGLRIGAAVPLDRLENFDVLKKRFKPLWDAVKQLADPILRNRATLAGNICTASPAGDSAPSLLVLQAEVETVSESGERVIPIQDFFTGVKRSSLSEDELVKSIKIPTPSKNAVGNYRKWTRLQSEDLALVGVAGLATDPEDGELRIALSSVGPTPLYVPEVEKILKKEKDLDKRIQKAFTTVKEKISPITDVRCSEDYRFYMAGILTKRVVRKILEE